MRLIITKINVNDYRKTINESVTEIVWRAGALNGSVIKMFPALTELHCCDNQLTSLIGLEHCTQLHKLVCYHNQLTSLTGLEHCTQLRELYCYDNKLRSLTGIEHCVQLQILSCSYNQLIDLTGLEHCTQLQNLICSHNQLTTLTELVYLLNLIYVSYSNNPLDIQTIQVQRYLTRFDTRRLNGNNSIYSDGQNVHDTTIQKTVCDSIQNLLEDPEPDFSIESIINSNLGEKTKQLLIDYCEDNTEHSHHLITYKELLSYVWARIVGSDHASELFKILEEQINDSECKCFTGRFNRTLSVLVGFYPDIQIEISDNSRIGAIILAIRAKMKPYDPAKHKELARKRLQETGYDKNTIELWLDAIE